MEERKYDRLKRIIDVAVAGLGIIISMPMQALVALTIRVRMGSPVLFRQERPGKNGEIFVLVKFRTMRMNSPSSTSTTDADRLTPLGRFLRSTSLDELPSLWNVLKGDMSLVGPRPLRTYYLPLYSPEQARRHEVRPGITGLAQVLGRNSLSWDERFELDVHYVDHRSFVMDCKILLQTVTSVVRRTGISADGHATMPPFTGSQDGQ